MTIELTEQQRRIVEGQAGRPIEVIDPDSRRSYMLIARDQFEKVRTMLEVASPAPALPSQMPQEIPPGIRRSQEAFWRDLPELLKRRRLRGQWVCYHGDEQVGIATTKTELVQQCLLRGLQRTEFYVGYIEERETPPWEPTALEESLFEAVEIHESRVCGSWSQLPLEISPGIHRAQEAFWRDLPELLKQRKLRGRWVCYHGDERVGISKDDAELFQHCLKRGLKRSEFYVGYIDEWPTPPWEPGEMDELLFEATEYHPVAPPAGS